jgi:hypothetical protein
MAKDAIATVSVRLPAELCAWLKALAAQERRSVSAQAVRLLEDLRAKSDGAQR